MTVEANGIGLLLITLGLIFGLSPTVKRLCSYVGVPVSVGYIGLGLLLGGVLERTSSPGELVLVEEIFTVLAQLGVVALLFRVGLRSHTSALLEKLPDASVIWLSNVFGSLVAGFAVAYYGLDWSLETSLVVGIAFSATSIAVSVAVWDELGLAGSETGEMLLDVAELDDLSAAVLLAVLVAVLPGLLNGEGNVWMQAASSFGLVSLKLALFIGGCYLFAHLLEARFTAYNERMSDTPATLTISILGIGLVIAAIGSFLGFSAAIGALFAGLAFSRDPEAVRTDGSFTNFFELLTPFFFVHIGMQVEVSALIQAMDIGLVLFVIAAAAKFVFTAAPALLTMSRAEATNLGISMIPRAEIALVVIYECRAISDELVSPEVFAAMVLVSLVSCIAAPILLRKTLSAN